jgi:hypothetical protein
VQIFYLALFEEKLNKLLDQLNQANLVSGRIPDIKKDRIIQPDIRCIPTFDTLMAIFNEKKFLSYKA